jgi:RHS repeat-associated protein
MISDNNKGISSISYNHLNFPTQVTFSNGGYISYKYDATGVKLSKVVEAVSEDPISTFYAGNYIYEVLEGEDSELQFFNHAEGYVSHDNGNFDYVYQYKDHLGNVRLSYTDADGDGVISDVFFADDLETASGWDSTGALNGYAAEYDTSIVHTGNYSGKIVNTASSERFVHSNEWLPINNTQATNYTFSGWLYSNGPSAEIFLFMKTENETGYFTQVNQVSTSTTGQWVYVEKTVSVPANIRYLNIRVDNNGAGTVWFDDIRIKKGASEIIEESNYYPFGLKQKGYNDVISANGNALAQRKKFGGFELQDELNLEWYDIKARNYDPALGRWFVVDAKADDILQVDLTPYNYSWNNPVNLNDPDGNCPFCGGFIAGFIYDAAVQLASNLANGEGFFEAVGNIDVADSVINGAEWGMAVQTGGTSLLVTDTFGVTDALSAGVDIRLKDSGGINTVFGGVNGGETKNLEDATQEFVISRTVGVIPGLDKVVDKVGGDKAVKAAKSNFDSATKNLDKANNVAAAPNFKAVRSNKAMTRNEAFKKFKIAKEKFHLAKQVQQVKDGIPASDKLLQFSDDFLKGKLKQGTDQIVNDVKAVIKQ